MGIGHAVDPNDTAEFAALAASAGTIAVGTILASRARPDPKFFVGSGKADEIRRCAEANDAKLILVDRTLSPSQERNLEKLINRRVLDRNGLILDIFAQRARSFEGKLQVELAQLCHLSTRLVRGWTHLERQKGGIGLRGPGETQLETDRRLVAKRIRTLRSRLEKLGRQRDTGRHVRREVPVPTVALVGYTNAGKSTLFNALTGSATYVADQLFATLDPTVRRLKLADVGEVVLADTVGFVRALPHELVAAFRSTLQEARDADLLLHVVDASDALRDERIEQVREVLRGRTASQPRYGPPRQAAAVCLNCARPWRMPCVRIKRSARCIWNSTRPRCARICTSATQCGPNGSTRTAAGICKWNWIRRNSRSCWV